MKTVDKILKHSKKKVFTIFNDKIIVAIKLPNNQVLTESCSCLDFDNYSKQDYINLCMERIKDKIYRLDGYHIKL